MERRFDWRLRILLLGTATSLLAACATTQEKPESGATAQTAKSDPSTDVKSRFQVAPDHRSAMLEEKVRRTVDESFTTDRKISDLVKRAYSQRSADARGLSRRGKRYQVTYRDGKAVGNPSKINSLSKTYKPGTMDFGPDFLAYGEASASAGSSNLWDRVRAGLKIPVPLEQAAVQTEMQSYAGKQEFLNRVVDRARPYLYYVVEELDRRGMPLDLALLPIIESAYQPYAQSPMAAAGMWQIIPGTGERLGLRQDNWYDGRRDIVASTRAALSYLQSLHRQFNGDWLLAVAAYNCGERNVESAINKNRASGKPVDFWSLSLPSETRSYVPRLLATVAVVTVPTRFNLAIKSVPNRPYFRRVAVNGPVNLARCARTAGISREQMFRLNAGFNSGITGPGGPFALWVPIEKADKLSRNLKRLVSRDLDQDSGNPFVVAAATQVADASPAAPSAPVYAEMSHTVLAGESLTTIAQKYSVPLSDLLSWNRMAIGSQVQTGQKVTIRLNNAPSAIAPGVGSAVTIGTSAQPQPQPPKSTTKPTSSTPPAKQPTEASTQIIPSEALPSAAALAQRP
jgi:membrane-bound lytic murein transglycosylase D